MCSFPALPFVSKLFLTDCREKGLWTRNILLMDRNEIFDPLEMISSVHVRSQFIMFGFDLSLSASGSLRFLLLHTCLSQHFTMEFHQMLAFIPSHFGNLKFANNALPQVVSKFSHCSIVQFKPKKFKIYIDSGCDGTQIFKSPKYGKRES